MYKYYPGMTPLDNQNKFPLEQVSLCHIVKEIKDSSPKRSSTINSIPCKVLKIASELLCLRTSELLKIIKR